MKTVATLLLLATSIGFCQGTASTRGRCSPAITQTGGNVTITYQSNSCPELDASTVATLKNFISKFPKTVDRLNELLDKKDVELTQRAKEIQGWISKYSELEKQLAAQADDSELSRRAVALLRDNDLDGARKLLDEIISRGESRLDVLAQDYFNRGQVFELEFRADQAVGQYQKATQYRPENMMYASAYGFVLAKQNRHAEAIVELEKVADKYRQMSNAPFFPLILQYLPILPDLAGNLDNLGNLYSETHRFDKAETAYSDALTVFRGLAKENPSYMQDVAATLTSIGNLYAETHHFDKAETAYSEALAIRTELAQASPDAYRYGLAMTLNSLGTLYDETRRFDKAEMANCGALRILRQLAQADSDAYEPDLAVTLNNIGNLYREMHRFNEAETVYSEALAIRTKLAQVNPDAYQPYLAMTLDNRGILYRDTHRFDEAQKAYSDALATFRKLPPDAYLPAVAITLNHFGSLYYDMGRFDEAEEKYSDALDTYQKLTKDNPDAYLPNIAMTLNNRGILYGRMQRYSDADKAYSEALSIRRKLAQDDPAAFTFDLAATLLGLALNKLKLNAKDDACQAYSQYQQLGLSGTLSWAPELTSVCLTK